MKKKTIFAVIICVYAGVIKKTIELTFKSGAIIMKSLKLFLRTTSMFSFLWLLVFTSAISIGQNTIVFDKVVHDFGKTDAGLGTVKCTFTFTNTGSVPLTLQSVQSSCGCITTNYPKTSVQPGFTGIVSASFNLTGRTGPQVKSLTVTSDGTPSQIILQIKADVQAATNQPAATSTVNNVSTISQASTGGSNQNILLQNSNHIIYYSFSGDNIVFTLEDIGDKVNNVMPQWYYHDTKPDGNYYGLYDDKGNNGLGTIKTEFCFNYDGSILEFDSDLNGILNSKDKGFVIQKYFDEVSPHYLSDKFRDPYFRNGYSVVWNTVSKASGNQYWKSSSFSSEGHPVATFTIPLKELLDFNTMQIKLRCVFIRAGGVKYKPNTALSTDTYHVYPAGQNIYYKDNKFFTIDLSKSSNPSVTKVKKEYDDNLAKEKSSKNEASLLRKLYTVEAMKKPITVLPKYDGVFIKLKNGKYIEINKQKLRYGILVKDIETYSSLSAKQKRPFFLQAEFDTLRFIQIEKSNFNGFSVVAGSTLKSVVDIMKYVYKIERYPLLPLPGAEYKLVEKAINTNNNVTGEYIEGDYLYWYNSTTDFTRTLGDSWSYNYTVNKPLEVGYYGLWMSSNIWVFEIIPDKVTTPKPVKK